MTEISKIADLTPDERNANLGTERGLRMLADSLRKYGAGRSILVDKKGRVIAGNKTLEQAVDIGLEDVIVVQTDGTKLVAVQRVDLDLDDGDRARALAYADNRTSEVGLDWNVDQLLADLEGGLDLSGLFGKDELDELLKRIAQEGPLEDPGPQMDRAAELQEKWGTALGQIWQLGEHRLAVGDCTDRAVIDAVMRKERACTIIADPPYGIQLDVDSSNSGRGDAQRVSQHPRNYQPIIGDDVEYDPFFLFETLGYCNEMFLWGADYYAERIPDKNKGSWLVWDKREGIEDMEFSSSAFELCWSRTAHRREIIRIRWAGVLGMESQDTKVRLHPTQKPIQVPEWILQKYTKRDEIVWDGYVGSGTTLIACERLNRRCRAIEIHPPYAAVTIQRWVDMTGGEPRLIES